MRIKVRVIFGLFLMAVLASILLAGLATGFDQARPGRVFRFPQDHGAHPDYKTEWWYYSGHLKSQAGESFGYQLTFFRVALKKPDPQARSAWTAHTVYFAHLALSDPSQATFYFREKANRGAMGLAGAEVGRLKVWVDDWRAKAQGEAHHHKAQTEELSLDLALTPLKPPVLHGEGGLSRKAAGSDEASYYYSITRLATAGHLTWRNRRMAVTGTSWLDREFSTSQLAPSQVGWDWFALHLSDGTDVMLYLMRRQDGGIDPASSGTLIDPQGQTRHLTLADFAVHPQGTWKSPHSRGTYPAGWQITIPAADCQLSLRPSLGDQELRTGGTARLIYWEGQVIIQGTKDGQPLSGQGYVELTGYAGSLGGRF